MKKIFKRSRHSKLGFSLVEILVAAILTILLAQATAAALRISVQTQNRASVENSFESAIVADLEQIRAISRELCRNNDFSRNETISPTNPNSLSYGPFEECSGAVFEQRCRATGNTAGFGDLLQTEVPAFSPRQVTVNGEAWTVSRQNLVVTRPLNSTDSGFAQSSRSVLEVRYNLTRGSTSITPAFVTQVVPEVVGSCAG